MSEFKIGDYCWSFVYSSNPLLSFPRIVKVKIKKIFSMDDERMVTADVIDSLDTVDLYAEDLFRTKLDAVMALEKLRDEE